MDLRIKALSPDYPAPGGAVGMGEPSSFLQSETWGEFKAAYGWSPLRFELEASGTRTRLLVLVKRMPAGFSFAYVPHGPELGAPEGEGAELLAGLSEALRPHLPKRCLFIRFDPPWYEVEAPSSAFEEEGEPHNDGGGEILRPRLGPPLRKAAYDVQPPDTVLLDLRPKEADILAAMKSKWRYNIRLAEKKGVVVEEAGAEAVGTFYDLYRTTSERDRIAIHPEEYYRRLFSAAVRGDGRPVSDAKRFDLRLWIARHEGRALAAIITLFYGEEGTYLYGASSDEGRNLMPTYALQWAAIAAAKAAGCLRYDLFGIPPNGDPGHPMVGLYRFKTGFGGAIAHRAGSWDYPLMRLAYAGFRAAEGARTWWYKDFKKRFGRPAKSSS